MEGDGEGSEEGKGEEGADEPLPFFRAGKLSWPGVVSGHMGPRTGDAALPLLIPKKSEETDAFSLLDRCFDSRACSGAASPSESSSCWLQARGAASSQTQPWAEREGKPSKSLKH